MTVCPSSFRVPAMMHYTRRLSCAGTCRSRRRSHMAQGPKPSIAASIDSSESGTQAHFIYASVPSPEYNSLSVRTDVLLSRSGIICRQRSQVAVRGPTFPRLKAGGCHARPKISRLAATGNTDGWDQLMAARGVWWLGHDKMFRRVRSATTSFNVQCWFQNSQAALVARHMRGRTP